MKTEYVKRYLLLCVGLFVMSVGVAANVVTVAGEGLVLAICKVVPIKFGTMKVCFDITLVIIAILIGFFGAGTLLGVREGTIAAALFVGTLSKCFLKPIQKFVDGFVGKEA